MYRSLLLCALLAACGGDDGTNPLPDGGTPDAPAFQTCEGACATTDLDIAFGATMRDLDRAFYGLTKDATGTTVRIEAHKGGSDTCPEESSPTPAYTLILPSLPIPTGPSPTLTSVGTFIDFTGDVVDGPPPSVRATAVTLTPVAANICPTCIGNPAPSHPDGMLALDVSLTFASGTITGHLYAIHCDSFDTVEP